MSRERRLTPAGASVLAIFVFAVHLLAAQTPPKFSSQVELVRLDVVVVDASGRPVEGLTAGDLVVEENGREREISTFEPVVVRVSESLTPRVGAIESASPQVRAPEDGRSLLFFVDDVHLAASTLQQLRRDLASLVERDLRDGDWVGLVAPQARVHWTARTSWERKQLTLVLDRIQGQYSRDPLRDRISDFAAMQAVERPLGMHGGSELASGPTQSRRIAENVIQEEIYAVARRRISTSLRSLRQALSSMAGLPGRKSLVFFSQGFVNAPRFPDIDEVIELARQLNVAVHFVDPRGLASTCAESGASESDCGNSVTRWMEDAGGTVAIAAATGGRDSRLNDPVAEVRRVLDESQSYYLIGYLPVDSRPGERTIQVRVRRDGLHVLARKRYVVLRPERLKDREPAAMAALHSMSDRADIRFRAEVRPRDDNASPQVTFAFALDPEPGPAARQLSLLIEARPRDRGEPVVDVAEIVLDRGDRPAAFVRRLKLAPGVWQARVVLRDKLDERLGSALLTFEVTPRDRR